jgi:AcrR family transcriptional regulator
MRKETPARPGGRSALVKTAVFHAVEALIAEIPDRLPSMAEIAARAQVNPTSLYRRWGNVSVLATEVAIELAMRDFPIPDTGSLKGDLTAWADAAAHLLDRSPLLRVLAANIHSNELGLRERVDALARRGQELELVLTRAKARGEPTPSLADVLEVVIAPIYFHVLFFGPVHEAGYAARLVDRLLTLASLKTK